MEYIRLYLNAWLGFWYCTFLQIFCIHLYSSLHGNRQNRQNRPIPTSILNLRSTFARFIDKGFIYVLWPTEWIYGNFFGKIQKSDLQQPPKFKQFALPKFGATALSNCGKQFFIKFCFYWKFKVDLCFDCDWLPKEHRVVSSRIAASPSVIIEKRAQAFSR